MCFGPQKPALLHSIHAHFELKLRTLLSSICYTFWTQNAALFWPQNAASWWLELPLLSSQVIDIFDLKMCSSLKFKIWSLNHKICSLGYKMLHFQHLFKREKSENTFMTVENIISKLNFFFFLKKKAWFHNEKEFWVTNKLN